MSKLIGSMVCSFLTSKWCEDLFEALCQSEQYINKEQTPTDELEMSLIHFHGMDNIVVFRRIKFNVCRSYFEKYIELSECNI